MSTQSGHTYLVENRAGANGVIGAEVVAKAPKDGYTVVLTGSAFVITDIVASNTPYSVLKDFAPVALVAKAPLVVMVNPQLGVKDIAGLAAYSRAHPGKLDFGVGSVGAAGHFVTELLKRSGIGINVIPYKGSTPAYQDMIGGQISGLADPILGALPFLKSGRVVPLGVTSRERLPLMPNTPTVGETLKGFEFYSWYGVWAPAGTPKPIITYINGEVNKALRSDLREKMTALGYILSPGTPEDLARFERTEIITASKIITEAKIHFE
jgi:tripartite-type tricarboxylate transporter receptor subunit TctC